MGLAADFGKSIVRGAGYSIGRNLVGSLGRNRITSNYRERVSDSYENQSINQKFGRSIFDVIDEQEESVKGTHQFLLIESNWDFIKGWKAGIFGTLGVALWFYFLVLVGIQLNSPFVKSSMDKYPLLVFLYLFALIVVPIFGSKFCLYLLHLVSGTPRKKKKHAEYVLDEGMKNIQKLRNSFTEGIEVVRSTWGEEWVESFEKRIPKEGMHISPFTLFFGSPDKEEITEKGKNLIYGTSKQAGDWFKFENDYLKSFTIK
jgi:hypothetical protein